MGLILKPTGNSSKSERVGMWEEGFPLSEGEKKTFSSDCKRYNTISGTGDIMVQLVQTTMSRRKRNMQHG